MSDYALSKEDRALIADIVRINGVNRTSAILLTNPSVLVEVMAECLNATGARRATIIRIRKHLQALRDQTNPRTPDHEMAPRALSCGCVLMVPKTTVDEGACPMHEGGA